MQKARMTVAVGFNGTLALPNGEDVPGALETIASLISCGACFCPWLGNGHDGVREWFGENDLKLTGEGLPDYFVGIRALGCPLSFVVNDPLHPDFVDWEQAGAMIKCHMDAMNVKAEREQTEEADQLEA